MKQSNLFTFIHLKLLGQKLSHIFDKCSYEHFHILKFFVEPAYSCMVALKNKLRRPWLKSTIVFHIHWHYRSTVKWQHHSVAYISRSLSSTLKNSRKKKCRLCNALGCFKLTTLNPWLFQSSSLNLRWLTVWLLQDSNPGPLVPWSRIIH